MTRRTLIALMAVACAILPTWSPAQPAQGSQPPTLAPRRLSDEQLARLIGRMAGTWRINMEKSVFLNGPAPATPPAGWIYAAEGRAIRWTTADGSSVQALDGEPHPGNVPNQTVARTTIDEFTVDNVVAVGGKLTQRNTHFYSPDGKTLAFIAHSFNDRGEETVTSFRIYEKVPTGTPVWPAR